MDLYYIAKNNVKNINTLPDKDRIREFGILGYEKQIKKLVESHLDDLLKEQDPNDIKEILERAIIKNNKAMFNYIIYYTHYIDESILDLLVKYKRYDN